MVDLLKEKFNFHDLLEIMEILRAPGGCPWDAEQTHESIKVNLLEESYEVVEAIDLKSDRLLREELGDVLLQVVFHSAMASGRGAFGIDDVCDGICKKLIHRHPHVFASGKADTPDEVLEKWDDIKRQEKGQHTHSEAMNQVAKSLPALMYAEKIQKKARKAGFDWPDVSGALEKVSEEISELTQAISDGGNVEEELGDLLFAIVNVSRFLKIDPENALRGATGKFMSRFSAVEQAAGGNLEHMTLEEMDKLWELAKENEDKQ